ncbi:GNAT family N-acetyltransferase [Actinoplanes sp. NPDC051861]|uniref:GNAT family N-acetyltransferase n=1 Tax=Actinoplanes sp. NPDC051861 TaxID=3155170 RepID=UPI00343F9322
MAGVVVRDLDGLAEWTAASALYRSVFGYTAPEWGLSPRLLAALGENSGTVIGAFGQDSELIGFCYGFCAVEGGEIYHYSQAAVVAPGAQGGGVGRLLKRAQAEAARRTGAGTMRWTFDPYAIRNAHFNFAVLGAVGIRFLPDFYGVAGTDRVLVSWDLNSASFSRTSEVGRVTTPAGEWIAAPGPADRARLRQQLMDHFLAGGRLTAVTKVGSQAVYVFGDPR